MKYETKIWLVVLGFLMICWRSNAQSTWPKEILLDQGGKVIIYQPQPESLEGNILNARAAISLRETAGDEPIFGAIWAEASLLTDRDERMATLENITITQVRFPEIEEDSQISGLKTLLEREIPLWHLDIAMDELLATLEVEARATSEDLSHEPPKIIYVKTPTMLVLIDGEPILKLDEELHMVRVINTPFLIVKHPDDQYYYLYGDKFWYQSAAVTQGWLLVKKLPRKIKNVDKQIRQQQVEAGEGQYLFQEVTLPPAILVSTIPAELIQSEGEPQFASIAGTSLLYMSNTKNDIFLDINNQQYYVVLSGRWYASKSLEGSWNYVPSDELPEDFAKIPEGSEKDAVLANVAGTEAAEEAILDAQIPQTAKVNRHSAICTVDYDGDPQFEPIKGTNLYVAVNASGTVLRANNQYFCVENGVWFASANATGPWEVATERPADVGKIPPSSSAYHVKYVYIYDVTPDFVYMGYTPGYLGCYVYGPTVVYGTGYYYRPWYGRVYFPRPVTWGFGMHYNPWTGWSMSFGFYVDWYYWVVPYRYYGGWWGPPVYRPPYRVSRYYGYRPPTRSSYYRTNNLYHHRRDVVTRGDRSQQASRGNVRPSRTPYRQPGASEDQNRPQTRGRQARPADNNSRQPAGTINRGTRQATPARGTSNNIYTDRQGNVYRRDQSGQWQRRDTKEWKPVSRENKSSVQQIQKQQEMRNRGQIRTNNFKQNTSRPATTGKGTTRGRPNIK